MATAQIDDDDDFGTFLAYSPTTVSLARTFGYVPHMSPLANTPPHISSAGVGLASIPPQQQQQQPTRVAPYKGTPPTGPLLSSTPTSTPRSLRRIMASDATPPSIGAAGVGLFSPSPTTHWNRRGGFILSIPPIVFSTPSTPRRQKTTKKKNSGDNPWFHDQFSSFTRGTHSSHTHHPQTRSIASTFSR